jgi:hypothetical protein
MILTEKIEEADYSSSSDSEGDDNISMDSNSKVDETHFQQQNYLFLFDQEIKFSQRQIGD